MKLVRFALAAVVLLTPIAPGAIHAQSAADQVAAPSGGVVVPADYVIGPDDHLGIVFWKDPDLSGEVVVRPDGKISLPLGKEIVAAGLTPEQLKDAVTAEAKQFVEAPIVNIIVRQINSR